MLLYEPTSIFSSDIGVVFDRPGKNWSPKQQPGKAKGVLPPRFPASVLCNAAYLHGSQCRSGIWDAACELKGAKMRNIIKGIYALI